MKIYVFLVSLIITGWFSHPATAQDNPQGNMLIVVDGKIASHDSLCTIPGGEIKAMHFLPPEKARNLYGIAGAHGALLVKTQADSLQAPIILKGGKRLPADSLQGSSFRKIEVIRGKQAQSLYGPAGKKGVFVVHPDEKRINTLLEIVSVNGRPIRGAAIRNAKGDTLAVTNKCGQAYLESILLGQEISVSHKKYPAELIEIAGKRVKIVLEN